MLNNLRIGTRLAIGFAIALLLMLAIAVIAVERFNSLDAEITDLPPVGQDWRRRFNLPLLPKGYYYEKIRLLA